MLNPYIPVLVIGFRRAEEIVEVFRSLEFYQPQRIYLAMDGPRSNKEKVLTENARSSALKAVTWKCDLQLLFSTSNIGCAEFVVKAITWFFSYEESGLILEDDILIHPSFIKFIQAYHSSRRFDCLCACTYESALNHQNSSLARHHPFASFIPSIWGWYTYSDVWSSFLQFSRSHNPYTNFRALHRKVGFWQSLLFAMCLDFIDRGLMNTWDYDFAFFMVVSNRLCLFPPRQFSSNIGNSLLATHCDSDSQLTESLRADADFISIESHLVRIDNKYMSQQSMNTLMKPIYKIQALKHAAKLILNWAQGIFSQ